MEIYLKTLLESIEGYVWCLDRERRYVFFNPRLQHIIHAWSGVTIQPGDPVYDAGSFQDAESRAAWEKLFHKSFQGASQHLMHETQIHGCHMYLELSLNPVWEKEQVVALVCTAKDITEQVGQIRQQLLGSHSLEKSVPGIKRKNALSPEVMAHPAGYPKKATFPLAAPQISRAFQYQLDLMRERTQQQRELVKAIIDTQEKQRAEIGRELHDNVNQMLTTAKLYLEFTLHKNAWAPDLVQKTLSTIDETITEIRRLTQHMVPPNLNEFGLKASIIDLVGCINEVKGDLVFYDLSSLREDRLEDRFKLTLFRIVQEQLNNTLKYAEATQIKILVHQKRNTLELSIEDNGKGFDTAARRKGIGISNIISRAECFRGQVQIDSRPGKGCRLSVQFRLDRPD